jgi:hypothetical protein
MVALSNALFEGGSTGRLPVSMPGLHTRGHGIRT